ncbi:MAG: hypothetical protein JSV43_01670 [Methanobacteriota archaeon]|nr:MAG: hypothetical protein JSV43_01670 [Euryarchaeota archaeon]
MPPSPSTPIILPLEHRAGNYEVNQSQYFAGLVLVPSNAASQHPDTIPATLPLKCTSQKKITVDVGGSNSPNGVVVLFTSRK